MKKILLAFLALGAGSLMAAPQVVSGPAPLAIDKDLTGSGAMEKIYVLTVIYPQLSYSVRSGELLTTLQKRYQAKGVEIYGILREKPEAVEKFAADHPEYGITLCADPELQSLKPILGEGTESFSRASILSKAGKLLWSGDPIDLGMMLERITSRRYSEREEIVMSGMVDQLQAAIRAGSPHDVIQAADHILEMRPEQLSAVNAKAFALERLGAVDELDKMLKTRIEKHPEWQESYFMLLEAGYRLPELAKERTFVVDRYLKAFPNDAQGLNGFAWSLLNNAPFDADAFTAAQKIVKHLETLSAAQNDGKVFATRALLAYRECDLARAKELLAKAMELTKNADERKALESLQKYFEAVGK